MNKFYLNYFCCPACSQDLLIKTFVSDQKDPSIVMEGVLYCELCRTLYPILDGIPFLLDGCYYEYIDITSFMRKWSNNFDFTFYQVLSKKAVSEKLKQINFYNVDSEFYDNTVSNSIFWKSSDWNTLHRWIKELPKEAVVLDLGCGTGRCTIPLARAGKCVFATDISLGMIKNAIKKGRESGVNSVNYFLADAEALPMKPNLFSTIISFGVLHHVNNPELIIRSASGLLEKGGTFYALENNASPLRPVFDFLMKIKKLWSEEAGQHPLFKKDDLVNIFKNNGMEPEIKTSTFLPPHLFNFIGYRASKMLLSYTDNILHRIPFIEKFGGQLVIKATKYRG